MSFVCSLSFDGTHPILIVCSFYLKRRFSNVDDLSSSSKNISPHGADRSKAGVQEFQQSHTELIKNADTAVVDLAALKPD